MFFDLMAFCFVFNAWSLMFSCPTFKTLSQFKKGELYKRKQQEMTVHTFLWQSESLVTTILYMYCCQLIDKCTILFFILFFFQIIFCEKKIGRQIFIDCV